MHKKHIRKVVPASVISLFMIVTIPAFSQQSAALPKIVLTERHSEIFTPPGSNPQLITVRSANPGVATAAVHRGNRIQIVAVAVGKTTVSFFNITNKTDYTIPVWVEAANPTGGGGSNFEPGTRIQLDQIVMRPKYTENVDVPGNSSPRISGVKSSNPSVATARTDPPRGIQVYAKALGDTFVEFVDDSTGASYQVHVFVTASGKLPGGGSAKGSSKPKGNEKKIAAPIGAAKLARCLVGSWVAETVGTSPTGQSFGSGIVMTIGVSGDTTVDYSNMRPVCEGNNCSYSYVWIGSVSVRISTQGDQIFPVNQRQSQVVKRTTDQGQVIAEQQMPDGGPGFLPSGSRFTCSDTALAVSQSSRGQENIRYRRQVP